MPSWTADVGWLYPLVSIVVSFWGYLLGSLINMDLVQPRNGTTMEAIGNLAQSLHMLVHQQA